MEKSTGQRQGNCPSQVQGLGSWDGGQVLRMGQSSPRWTTAAHRAGTVSSGEGKRRVYFRANHCVCWDVKAAKGNPR